jgi:peptide/nickel transport system substrate-binding protein
MDIRLLGPVEVSLGDGPVALGPRKQRAVLAMLALQVGRTVSVDRLIEGLWGEEAPASGAKMVQLYVSHLRRVLDGDGARIVTHGRGYALQLSDGDVDAVRFERLVEESRSREALALWRGEPLADMADEPFATAEIRRLGALRLRAAEGAIDADLDAGRHAEVIGELEALVAEEPLREHVRAQYLLALYRAGRQSDALAAYRAARAELVEQIGVEPGAELQGMHEAILAHAPALDLPAPADEPPTAPRPQARRAPKRLLVGAAVLLLAGITAFGVIRVLGPEGLAGIDENAVGLIDPDNGRITKQIPVGRSPTAVVGGGGSVWIASGADGRVTRVVGDQAVSIPVRGAPAALAFGGGTLWVADSESRYVSQIDPGRDKVVRRFEVGNAPRALAVAGGAVWVASGVDGQVRRIDLERGRVTRSSVAVGGNPSALAAGAGALWVASEEAGTVTRVEPRTGTVGEAIPVGNGPTSLATGEGAVWVVNRQGGTLARIDPGTNSVSGVRRVGRDPTAVAAGGGAVWVAGGEDGTVTRVDPGLRTLERVKTGSSPAAVAVSHGLVWAAATAPPSAHRGGTLRVLFPVSPKEAVPVDWVHPKSFDGPHTFQVASLAYDGLVAYRRVEGAAAATLVGALATNVPAPSRDGRSYVFTLRPGIRYSDGSPVRPEDVRFSMERFLRVTRRNFPEYFAGIIGARECVRRPARCDLSRGIETDPRARTVTIHLTRPEAGFLHKLTHPFAYVVPGNSLLRSTTGVPPPGTGPYRVAAWRSHRGGVLVRNPHFRARPARPAGFADRVEIQLRDGLQMERQIADVQQGRADVMALANPFVVTVTPERLRQVVARSPGRVYSRPAPSTDWMFLNVRRGPFDDPDVRRAVNLAIDRAHIVALTGGREVGQPSCQILPVAFPGYEPYCPFTANPNGSGTWIAPDLSQARRLVKESGSAGERVVVWVPDYRLDVGRYFTALLNRLGLAATLRVTKPEAVPIYRPGFNAQTGSVGWAADFMSPETFMVPNFGCTSRGDPKAENLSRVCDRTLTRLIDSALAKPGADAGRAWAAVDRRVTDLAVAVPMTSRRAVVLVSERVGNVQNHGQWFTLLDQMWVR